MKLAIHGAAHTVTGSKHLLELQSGKKVLLDCGMFQGMGKDTETLNTNWGFEPSQIDYVILSHAHIDHSGLLPKLVKDGFTGPIFCTAGTADLVEILLPDSAHIQQADTEHVNKRRRKQSRREVEPIYSLEDAERVIPMLHRLDYDRPFRISDELEVLFTDCGHIVGSAAINLKITEGKRIIHFTFSGDIGQQHALMLRSPKPFPQADYIVMESTYGNSLHDPVSVKADKFLEFIQQTCLQKKGRLIIPAFSIGRTQEILYLLNQLDLEGRLPALEYFVDSPLSISATKVARAHPESFNDEVQKTIQGDQDIFSFKGLQLIKEAQQSIALNEYKKPCVIISASGMAEAGRVKHHIVHGIEDPRNTILLTGYCEPHSLGGRLIEHPATVNIYGQEYEVKARIASLKSLSAHGDYEDLCKWLECQDSGKVKKLFLVHGEYRVQQAFRERLLQRGFSEVEIPLQHQQFEL
ncbi:MAG: MBL fold metallo-hydrolase [Chitinophagales bacterium]